MTTRGRCQICGTIRPVRADGTLRAHWDHTAQRRCMGSGWTPSATVPGTTIEPSFQATGRDDRSR